MRVDLTVLLLLSFLGQQPTHKMRFLDEGNTDISTPISETTVIAAKVFLSKTRDSVNQVKGGCERGDEAVDFNFNLGAVHFEFVDVVETLMEFGSLLMGNSSVHNGLNLVDRGFKTPVNERRNGERIPGVR